MLARELPEPRIELLDLFDWLNLRPPRKSLRRQDACQYDLNAIQTCQINHGADVVLEVIGTAWARISGQIVRARHDVDSLRMQRYDVLIEAHQHLGTGLSADAAIYNAATE